MKSKTLFVLFLLFAVVGFINAQDCIDCHRKVTPKIVSDWELSKHKENQIGCDNCHGTSHSKMDDFSKEETQTQET